MMMTWHTRLTDAFEATGWSKQRLADLSGVSYDSVNKYLAGGVKQPRGDALNKLAAALNLEPLFLEKGIDLSAGTSTIPVMGYVGGGAEVEPEHEQVPPDGMFEVTVPFVVPEDMIALQVRGDSMRPQYNDGAVLVVYREQRRALESFFGEEACVRTTDGRRFVKTIMRGANGGVSLFSWNATPIENVHLDWIGEIFVMVPPHAMRRIDRAANRTEARKMA